ncbi:hypothetical protein F4808DRAFT_259468 [Astrocystis sublimbata]|nr:hypothetical protein F4808DRAFT_259468 [Astrocystis sublimbata]
MAMTMTTTTTQNAHVAGDPVHVPYFPRSGAQHTSKLLLQRLPTPPAAVGPIFDPERCKVPIPPFNREAFDQNYQGPSDTGEAVRPPTPVDFADKYLVPTLARNERLRLTMLWYHTRHIEKDERLLAELDTLVRGIHKLIGWDYAITGVLNESTYRRLAAVNLPLAILPRRESTCSHTINQDIDGVFMVLDMSEDWRFKHSPHSEIGGLKSYAGTPLRLTTDNGVEIPLGSLCVASDTPRQPLQKAHREALVSFAELISTAIASHTQRRRLQTRQEMTMLLSDLRSKIDAEDHEESAIAIIQRAYPKAHVSLSANVDGRVPVEGRPAVELSDVEAGLWEDTALIEQTIMSSNFELLKPSQTVRAIIARCGGSEKYIVVSGLDIHHVFDDFDAWFVFKAAAIIAELVQNRLLRQALAAKETFLRGITHQLRTPIHGVLSSAELLAEELRVRGLLSQSEFSPTTVSSAACLDAIRRSGQELMRTVNSMLKYNTWTDTDRPKSLKEYDLLCLESDMLPHLLTHVPEDHLRRTSIEFRNELSYPPTIVTDPDLLKDCLQEVLLNAMQSVAKKPSGTVSLTMRNDENARNLVFDVIDNGVGINEEAHGSIFEPFFKADDYKIGAGFGLTIARQIAAGLEGTVKLVSSRAGAGSHFRVAFSSPVLATPPDPNGNLDITLGFLPRTYHWVTTKPVYTHFGQHIARYLEMNKFKKHAGADVGLVFADSDPNILRETYPSAVIVLFGEATTECGAAETRPELGIITCTGPLHTETLKAILSQADGLHRQLAYEIARQAAANEALALSDNNHTTTVDGDLLVVAHIASLGISDTIPPPEPQPQPGRGDRPIRALLVDDNSINLRVLQMYCTKRKLPFATAEDGRIAINKYIAAAEANEPFTLVLMDLQMPNCDGVEATRVIRAYEDQHKLCRSFIFMVTGQDCGRDKSASQEAGTDIFLIKPVPPKMLDKHVAGFFTTFAPAGG